MFFYILFVISNKISLVTHVTKTRRKTEHNSKAVCGTFQHESQFKVMYRVNSRYLHNKSVFKGLLFTFIIAYVNISIKFN